MIQICFKVFYSYFLKSVYLLSRLIALLVRMMYCRNQVYGFELEDPDFDMTNNEEEDKEIQALIDNINSKRVKGHRGYTYDLEGNYLGYMTSFGDLILKIPEPGTPMDAYEEEPQEICISKSETIMDASVPPPVQQNQVHMFLDLSPFPTDDDFFSDEEEEMDGENFAKYTHAKDLEDVVETEVDLSDSIQFMFEEEEDVNSGFKVEDEVVEEPSWEEEFGEELVDMPTFIELAEFDPVGELELLEALLEEPKLEINQDSMSEVKVDDIKPPKSTKPQEKARKRMPKNPNRLQILGRYKKKRKVEPLKFGHNHSPCYMPHIRFGPGKFKCWWHDPFEKFRIYFKFFIENNFINNKKRKELNGLDRVCIKEKPPDYKWGCTVC